MSASSNFVLNGQTGQYVASMGKAEKSTDNVDKSQKKMGKSAERTSRSTDKLTASIGKGRSAANQYAKAAAVAGLALTAAFVGAGLKSGDELAKISDKLGIATEKLAGLRHAAELTGVSSATMDTALEKLNVRMAEAATGTGLAVKSFDALGISSEELVKLSPDKAMGVIADKISRVENSAQKAKIAYDIFGRSGVGLINTLQGGSEGLDAFQREAEELGIALGRVDARKIEIANDEMQKGKTIFAAFSQQLAVTFAPVIAGVAREFVSVAKEAGGMGAIAAKVFASMAKGVGVLADGLHGIKIIFKVLELGVRSFAFLFLKSWDQIFSAVAEVADLLPGIDIQYESSTFSKFVDEMRDDMFKTQNEIADLLMEELPSQGIERFVGNVTVAFEEEAKAVQESQQTIQGALITTEDVTESLSTTTTKAAKEVESAWDKAIQGTVERIDSAFSEAWKGAFDSFSDFGSSLKDAFKNLIAELAHLAITRPIVMSIGASLGLPSAAGAATGGGDAGDIGSLISGGSSAYSLFSGTGGIAGGVSALGASGFHALSGLGSFGSTAAMNIAGAGQSINGLFGSTGNLGADFVTGGLATAGAGIAGNALGNVVFGDSEYGNVGGTVGSIAGAVLGGPIGAAIGSFIGNGLGSLVGGTQREDKTGQSINFATGAVIRGDSRGHDFDDAADAIGQQLLAFSQSIGGSNANVDFRVHGKRGLGVTSGVGTGNFGEDSEAFFDVAFDQIIRGADHLSDSLKNLLINFEGPAEEIAIIANSVVSLSEMIKTNPVDVAVQDFARSQEAAGNTLFTVYQKQHASLLGLISGSDGSASSLADVNAAMIETKASSYQLALGIQAISEGISTQFSDTAKYFRDSILSEGELREAQLAERQSIRDSISSLIDPEEINEARLRLDELSRTIFDGFDDSTQGYQSQFFAKGAESDEAQLQRRLDISLDALRQREDESIFKASELVQNLVSDMNGSASMNMKAAEMNLEAARLNAQNTSQSRRTSERVP